MASKYNFNILLFIVINLTPLNTARNVGNFKSEITLLIKGSGPQKILSEYFKERPYEVLINGQKAWCNKICNLKGDKNKVTLIFKKQIKSCQYMFSNLDNVIEIDLSKLPICKKCFMDVIRYNI